MNLTTLNLTTLNFISFNFIQSSNLTEVVGFIAACLTTAAFVPQAYQSWKTRDLSGISLPMYSLFSLGVASWLGYGLLINSMPIIVANSITLVLSCIVLGLKMTQPKAPK